jgi:hypothetical protein
LLCQNTLDRAARYEAGGLPEVEMFRLQSVLR